MKLNSKIAAGALTLVLSVCSCTVNRGENVEDGAIDSTLVGDWLVETVECNDSVTYRVNDTAAGALTIEFDSSGIYQVTTECHTLHGSYSVSGGHLRLGRMLGGRPGCDTMPADRLVHQYFPGINHVNFEGDTAAVISADDSIHILLHRR